MRDYLVLAAGRDRPGIVAAVTKALLKLRCNLADSAMTRLASEFAILLIASAPRDFDEARAERELAKACRPFGLFLKLKPLSRPEARSASRGRAHGAVVSVHGADRPGIVYRVSSALALRGINITDVSTRRTGGRSPGFVLLLEVEARPRELADIERSLRGLSRRWNLRVSVRPVETERL